MNGIFPKNAKLKFPEIDITNPELGKDWEGHFKDMHSQDHCKISDLYMHDFENYKLGKHNCAIVPVSDLLDDHCPKGTYEDVQKRLFETFKIANAELEGMINWYEWNW